MPGKALGLALSALLATGAQAQQPLSAIDWLSDVTVTPPRLQAAPGTGPAVPEEEVSRGVSLETITVMPLDAPSPDAVGLLPSGISGLPPDLWGPTGSAELAALLAGLDPFDLLPETRDLLYTLLLAELDAPIGADQSGQFLLARIETLMRLGALEQAHAMLERAGVETAAQFALWMDLNLLKGTERQACRLLQQNPGLSDAAKLRVFCLARLSDWSASAVTFGSARVLGALSPEDERLLARFLDAEQDEGAAALVVPVHPSPLDFVLFEAIGEALPTIDLPLAFAHADLRPITGWKAQIDAAERLARVGALPSNQLLGLYTERKPAASGGVWDRVAAVQKLDRAMASGDSAAVGATLPAAWTQMQRAGLALPFAEIYAERLQIFDLPPIGRGIAARIGLLAGLNSKAMRPEASPDGDGDGTAAFLTAVAEADPASLTAPNAMGAAIAEAFAAPAPPERYIAQIESRAIGAALLQAIGRLGDGRHGDFGKVTETLSFFRFLGLETIARRTALELLILGPDAI